MYESSIQRNLLFLFRNDNCLLICGIYFFLYIINFRFHGIIYTPPYSLGKSKIKIIDSYSRIDCPTFSGKCKSEIFPSAPEVELPTVTVRGFICRTIVAYSEKLRVHSLTKTMILPLKCFFHHQYYFLNLSNTNMGLSSSSAFATIALSLSCFFLF